MEEIISEFQAEAKQLIVQLIDLLESIEGDATQFKRLEEYGQIVDRIMGTSKSLAVAIPELSSTFQTIGQYGELCKLVAYKGSQVSSNDQLYTIVTALLLDATEMLQELVDQLSSRSNVELKSFLSEKFIDRLKWLSGQFPSNLRGTLASAPSQVSIDELLKSFKI